MDIAKRCRIESENSIAFVTMASLQHSSLSNFIFMLNRDKYYWGCTVFISFN